MEHQLGFNRDLIEQAVTNNKHNHLSATYYLLLKKSQAQELSLRKDGLLKAGNQTQTNPPVIKLSIEQAPKSAKHTPGGDTSERPQSAT